MSDLSACADGETRRTHYTRNDIEFEEVGLTSPQPSNYDIEIN